MDTKKIIATIFLKNGKAVRSMQDMTEIGDVYELAKMYNDSGVDKIIIFDLSSDKDDHALNIKVIQNINRNIDVKVCAGGNINRLDDVKNLFYAGCKQIVLNASKGSSFGLADMISSKFGQDSLILSVSTADFIFKHQKDVEHTFHELLILNPKVIDSVETMTDIPYTVYLADNNFDHMVDILKRDKVRGVAGDFINHHDTDIMLLKTRLSEAGIRMDNFAPALQWKDLKLNSDGMVPVIVQDYRTDEVLMLAYMNEEAYNTTLHIGKMTYWSRSRNELWIKGETSGHYQYVKSLTADCDYDTILAKVSQIGAACHTGKRSCFHNPIVSKEYVNKNPLFVLETLYKDVKDREVNPSPGSYTSALLSRGLDEVLKKLGSEATEIVIASKNPDKDQIKFEISDLLYHLTILMAQKDITWEDVTKELSQR